MAIAVEMPKMSDTMDEGVLVAWLVEEGANVSSGDVIAQVETDKATMDLEVYDDGVLLKRVVPEGASVPIGGLIAVLGKEGEDISDILGGDGKKDRVTKKETEKTGQQQEEAPKEEASKEEASKEEAVAEAEPAPASVNGEGRLKASPLARKMAEEQGVNLGTVQGSGPEGRIVKRDVEAILSGRTPRLPELEPVAPAWKEAPLMPGEQAPRPQAAEAFESTSISQMRKTIARRLAESKFTAPHFYLTVDVDMEKSSAFRTQLNAIAETQEKEKISFNDLITKACAISLKRHPNVNASYLEKAGEIRHHKEVHVAVAVAIDEGLVTPVIRNADQKGLGQIAADTRDLATRARERKLQPADWEGSTFTTSNLGMFGIEEFTAIINPPNSCILAIGAIRDVPVVKNGAVVAGKRMKLTLSCDHRLVDGATGAQFLSTVKQYLEEPLNLLL